MNNELSKYTITVYELQENGFDFGLQDYEIFNEEYRPILNDAILNYYKFREIGYLNPNIWKDRLNNRMNLIMRNKYNALYEAKTTEFNALYNVDMTETFTHEIENTNSNTNNTENTNDINTSNILNSNTTNTQNGKIIQNGTNTVEGSQTTENKKNDTIENTTTALNSSLPTQKMTMNDLSDNVFVDNMTRQTTNETNSNTENNSQKSSNTTNIKQENNAENTESIESENTNTIKSTNKNTTSARNSGQGKTTETYTKKTLGSSAGLPFSKAMIQLKEFYDVYNLDQLVINELKDLFFNLW